MAFKHELNSLDDKYSNRLAIQVNTPSVVMNIY